MSWKGSYDEMKLFARVDRVISYMSCVYRCTEMHTRRLGCLEFYLFARFAFSVQCGTGLSDEGNALLY